MTRTRCSSCIWPVSFTTQYQLLRSPRSDRQFLLRNIPALLCRCAANLPSRDRPSHPIWLNHLTLLSGCSSERADLDQREGETRYDYPFAGIKRQRRLSCGCPAVTLAKPQAGHFVGMR
jgi:hypothetical protein